MMNDVVTQGAIWDEFEVAEFLKLSIHTIRKDRTSRRLIPFYRIGSSVRYSESRVREALHSMEMGGPPSARGRK